MFYSFNSCLKSSWGKLCHKAFILLNCSDITTYSCSTRLISFILATLVFNLDNCRNESIYQDPNDSFKRVAYFAAFFLMNYSEFFLTTLSNAALEKLSSAVREAGVSRHNKDPLRTLLKPVNTVVFRDARGIFVGAPNRVPMMPRDGSLSDSDTSDHCCFSSLVVPNPNPKCGIVFYNFRKISWKLIDSENVSLCILLMKDSFHPPRALYPSWLI